MTLAGRNSKSGASPARSAAYEILLQVARKNAYASELLHSQAHQGLSPADHGLATELVMGVLRWLSVLDDEIARRSSQPLEKLDLEVLTALRIAVYQLTYLERIPASAAVNESVELVKRARKHSAAPFVNAVLRKIARERSEPIPEIASSTSTQEIARRFSHPEWMVERWVHNLGMEAAQAICAFDQRVPETAIRMTRAGESEQLKAAGIELAPGRLLKSARIVCSGNITAVRGFREGRIAIQDEASQLVALLVGRGSAILDCCAAPGGKTRILAEGNPHAAVIATELHPHRARLLRRLVRNQHVAILAADVRSLPLSISFDRVLADVPCSGTGTLSRNPDIKWRLRPEDLVDLSMRQSAILRSAMERVLPGGRIVYASCSLEPEENEVVIEEALREDASFHLIDCRTELQRLRNDGELVLDDLSSMLRGPYLRTIPGIHQSDGFFAAILEKRG